MRCALDLGLRSIEVAQLSLDDIDWHAGTITLRHTKGRRVDILPLPVATGAAIARYLELERPKTSNRAIKPPVLEIRAWLRLNPALRGEAPLLPNRDGQAMCRSNVTQRLSLAVTRATMARYKAPDSLLRFLQTL